MPDSPETTAPDAPNRPTVRRWSFARRALLLGALALVVRLIYLGLLGRHVGGIGDFFFYHESANALAEGKGYRDPFLEELGVPYPTTLHPPLWPALLAVPSLLGVDTILGQRVVGCVLGALLVVVLAHLGRAVAGERVGLFAGGLAALTPNLFAADGSLMAETLYGLFVAAALVLAVRSGRRLRPGPAAALGALLGLAALTRGEGLLFLLLLAAPLALVSRGGRRLATLAAVVLGAAVVVVPWTVRNELTFGAFIPISTNEATVAAGANCDATYSGPDIGYWRLDCIRSRDLTLDEAQQATAWREDGRRYLREHERRLLVVAPVRVLRTWDLWEPTRQISFGEGRDRGTAQVGLVVYYVETVLAVGGLVLLWRRRAWLTAAILVVPAVVVTVTSAVGFGMPRFRHAAELAIVVLAAVALERLTRRRFPDRPVPPVRRPAPARVG